MISLKNEIDDYNRSLIEDLEDKIASSIEPALVSYVRLNTTGMLGEQFDNRIRNVLFQMGT